MALTPYPHIEERPLPDKFGAGMSWLYRFPAVASWWHTMVGTLWGTDAYFRFTSTLAATDYGIGGIRDGAYDGVIFRWINYNDRQYTSGWASGWSNAPDFDDQGKEFFAKYGASGVNPRGRSVEFSGLVADLVTAKQWAAGIHLTAAIHHHEIKQGYEEFAWNMHHREVAEKDCPFPRIYNYTTEYQKGIVEIMRHYETGADIPEKIRIAGLDVKLAGGADPAEGAPAPNKPIMVAFPKEQIFHTVKGAVSRQWGYVGADIVRRYEPDTRLRTKGYYHGQEVNGDDRWLVIVSPGISNNARLHVSGVKERILDPAIEQ
jgi:hypothetical protein